MKNSSCRLQIKYQVIFLNCETWLNWQSKSSVTTHLTFLVEKPCRFSNLKKNNLVSTIFNPSVIEISVF